MILKGRKIVGGYVEGEIIVSKDPVSFYGGIDPYTGMIVEPGHSLYGKKISGKVFVFPTGKGSTVGSYVIYQMKKLGTAPIAILNKETESILATGCVISEIPLIDKINSDQINMLKDGMHVSVKADEGIVEIF
jgi:predicted aconitase with swiveling domain